MALSITIQHGVGVAAIAGTLTAANVDTFRETFHTWLTENDAVSNIVMDLGRVELIDSSGLGTLIALLKRISERGGDMKLAGLQKKVRLVFEITRAYKIFEIFDSVEEATRAFA